MSNKNKVYESYNKIAEWFDEHRSRDLFEKPHLDKAIEHLSFFYLKSIFSILADFENLKNISFSFELILFLAIFDSCHFRKYKQHLIFDCT
jgi:hypothetical protein